VVAKIVRGTGITKGKKKVQPPVARGGKNEVENEPRCNVVIIERTKRD